MNHKAIDQINNLRAFLPTHGTHNTTSLNCVFTPAYYYFNYFYSLGNNSID